MTLQRLPHEALQLFQRSLFPPSTQFLEADFSISTCELLLGFGCRLWQLSTNQLL